jgi:hypothetical protein
VDSHRDSWVTVVCAVFFLFYFFIVSGSAKKHDREYGERKVGRRGEGRGFETSTNMS